MGWWWSWLAMVGVQIAVGGFRSPWVASNCVCDCGLVQITWMAMGPLLTMARHGLLALGHRSDGQWLIWGQSQINHGFVIWTMGLWFGQSLAINHGFGGKDVEQRERKRVEKWWDREETEMRKTKKKRKWAPPKKYIYIFYNLWTVRSQIWDCTIHQYQKL